MLSQSPNPKPRWLREIVVVYAISSATSFLAYYSMGPITSVKAFALILLAVFSALCVSALWRGQRWVRVVSLVGIGLWLIDPLWPSGSSGLVIGNHIFAGSVNLFFVYWLFRPDVREYFRPTPKREAESVAETQ